MVTGKGKQIRKSNNIRGGFGMGMFIPKIKVISQGLSTHLKNSFLSIDFDREYLFDENINVWDGMEH